MPEKIEEGLKRTITLTFDENEARYIQKAYETGLYGDYLEEAVAGLVMCELRRAVSSGLISLVSPPPTPKGE